MKKLAILPLIFLAACAKEPVYTKPVVVEKPKFVPPAISPANQAPFEWVVITKDNMQEKLAELEKTEGVVVLFALTPQGYQNLSMNVSELRRYIQQQNAVIAAMRKYYDASPSNDR